MVWRELDRTDAPLVPDASALVGWGTPEREHDRLLALHRVSTLVAGQRRTEDVLREALVGAVSLVRADAGAFYRWDPNRNVLHPDQTVGLHASSVPIELEAGEGVAGLVFSSQSSIVENEYQTSALARPGSLRTGLRAMVAVPVSHGGRRLGVLAVCTYAGASTFDELDAQLLELFAAQVAVALDNAELNARLEDRLERIRTLNRLARLVSTSLDLDEVLRQIARAAVGLTGASFASFWLADEESRTLRLGATSDDTMAADTHLTLLAFGEGLTGQVAETRRSLLLDDVLADGRVGVQDWWRRQQLKSCWIIPIVHDGALLAVLGLAGRHSLHLGPAESEVMESFLTQAAVAIRNASLYTAQRQSQEQLRGIVEHSPAAISLKDRSGRYLLTNQRWQERFRVEAPGPLGLPVDALQIPSDRAARMRAHDRLVLEEGRALEYEETIDEHGVTHTYLVVKFPLFDAAREPYAVCTITADISERKRWEEEIAAALASQRAANEQLERLNTAKSDFVSFISHEFRSPLTGIQGFSELLRYRELPIEAMREFAGDIHREAERLARMINELLDLDRMESGQMLLHPDLVDLGAVVRDVVGRARPHAPRHTLCLALDPVLTPVLGDPDKLTQVVLNMLDNAIKYSPDGGDVVVGARDDGTHLALWVEDHGVGIPADALDAIFDRYTRLTAGLDGPVVGTGLGLPIVRQIVELHGGRVWAESELGRGSTFHVTLPLDR
jgi:PAS domain S-box-containing protein